MDMSLEQMLQQTGKRQASFEIMINHLKQTPNPLIVETGCSRSLQHGFHGDGFSTIIFDKYVETHSGQLLTVDLDENHVNFSRSQVSQNTQIFCQDSVTWLHDLNQTLLRENKKINLLYLDSFDFYPHDPHPSSFHHMKELTAIWPCLSPGTMIAIDDNFGDATTRIGKGKYVEEFLQNIRIPLVYDGYQLVWLL
jgi:hypothetical protein